VGGIGIKLDLK